MGRRYRFLAKKSTGFNCLGAWPVDSLFVDLPLEELCSSACSEGFSGSLFLFLILD